MPHLSIRARLNLSLSVILLLSFMLISVLSYRVSREALRARAIDELIPILNDKVHSEIQGSLLEPAQAASLMANDAFLRDWAMGGERDVSRVTRYLEGIRDQYGYASAFFISDRTRNYYHAEGILKRVSREDSHDVWYYDFLDLDVASDLDVDNDEAEDGRLTVFINHRVEDYEGRLLGVTGVGVVLDDIGSRLLEFGESHDATVFLTDASGVIQVHPDRTLVETTNIYSLPGLGAAADGLLVASAEGAVAEYAEGGERIFVSSRHIPQFDWHVIIQRSDRSVLSEVRANLVHNLAAGALVTAIVIVISTLTVNAFQTKLETLATRDSLTNLANRRHLLDLSGREIARARRYGQPVAVLALDLDHFKNVNDRYGHEIGDAVLRAAAEAVRSALREVDLVGRTGGEEFVAVLPGAGRAEALAIAERVRRRVGDEVTPTSAGELRVSVSIGAAVSDGAAADLSDLMRRADAALYEAKAAGRNTVRLCDSDAMQADEAV